jgi:hypothetical protein
VTTSHAARFPVSMLVSISHRRVTVVVAKSATQHVATTMAELSVAFWPSTIELASLGSEASLARSRRGIPPAQSSTAPEVLE